VDVTPYTFGTSALGELDGEPYPYLYVPIIPRNTPIPVRKSEVFYTINDNQSRVNVRIFQGEDPDALSNIQIGEFLVEGLSRAPAGNPVVLDLALDQDGILHVAAREKNTGLERRISIEQAVPRLGAAELEEARDRIDALFGDGAEEEQAGASSVGDAAVVALLDRARARLDTAGEEDRNEIVDLMETIRDTQVANNVSGFEQARTQLTDLLFYLET
jgi:molecular chaperone DnaK